MEMNENYRDFSNRKSFNNEPLFDDEELVPAVLTKELRKTLIPKGLDYSNVETWTFKYGKKVKVVFIPYKKGFMDSYIKQFNIQVVRYLKHKDEIISSDLSLDKFIEDMHNDDGRGFDPTGTTKFEDLAQVRQILDTLIEYASIEDEKMGEIIHLLAKGYNGREILEKVELGIGTTQGYERIKKAIKLVKQKYDEDYRD